MLAQLKIDGKDRDVMHCRINTDQMVDDNNRPAADVRVGLIELILDYETGDEEAWKWSIAPFDRKSGSIIFTDPETGDTLRTVEFSDAHCVGYESSFTEVNPKRMTETVVLAPVSITIDGATVKAKKKK